MKVRVIGKNIDILILFNFLISTLLAGISIYVGILIFIFTLVIFIMEMIKDNEKEKISIKYISSKFSDIQKCMLMRFSIANEQNKIMNSNMNKKRILEIIDIENMTKSEHDANSPLDNRTLHNKIIKTKDILSNSYMYYLYTKYPIINDQKEIIGHIYIQTDTTNLIRYQNELISINELSNQNDKQCLREQILYKDVLNNSVDALLVYSFDMHTKSAKKLILYSENISDFLSFHPTYLKDKKSLIDAFHKSECERVDTILSKLPTENSLLFETLMDNGNGNIPVEINSRLCKINNEDILYLNIRDVSFRKRMEEHRDRNRVLLAYKNREGLINYILHTISIKFGRYANVINKTLNYINKESNLFDKEIDEIKIQLDNTIKSINDAVALLSSSSIKSYVNIKSLVEFVRDTIFFKDIMNNTVLTVTQIGDVEDIYIEEYCLSYVLIMLIVNSKEAIEMNKGTRFYGSIDITISNLDSNYILLSIEDNGGGIDDAKIGRIFDLFYTTKENRLGISLVMCKMIIEDKIGGNIIIKNTANGVRVDIKIIKDKRGGGE